MRILVELVKRNMKLFLRDKASVFFSFLSVIIIIVMYALFLGKLQTDALQQEMQVEGIDWLVNSWIMAGIVTVSTVTVPLGALGLLIDDRTKNRLNDFYTSPINRNVLALSYLISAWVIGFVMVFLNLIIGQIYVVSNGGEFLTFLPFIKVLGLMLLSIMTFSSMFFYIAIFMKTQNAFGLLSTLVGTFIGFLGGIYVPIGQLPENVKNIMNILPSAHSVTLIRNVYMEQVLDFVFTGAPAQVLEDYKLSFGLKVDAFGYDFTSSMMLLSMIGFGLLFYVLSVIKLSKSKL